MSDPVEGLSVDNLDFGLVTLSHDLAITGLNAKARMIFGAQGHPSSKIPASEIPQAWKKIVCVDDGPVMHFRCEVSGRERWFERTRVPGGRKGGLPEGWLFVLYEITGLKKQHETQLRDLHERYERKRSQQWTMLLQDLHDGIGSISNSIGMLAALAKTRAAAEDKDKLLTQIGALAREGNIEV